MTFETTCKNCGNSVRGERTFYNGGYFDTFEPHECEVLKLTEAQHIEYKSLPQPSQQE